MLFIEPLPTSGVVGVSPSLPPAGSIFIALRWDDMINSGKTIGEVIYETSPEYLKDLDIESNKNNRVTAAQFASKKPLLNTPHSPRSDNMLTPDGEVVKNQPRQAHILEDFESTLSQEDLDDIEAEVDRRMIDKDEQITALNNQIAELSSQRDELMQNEKENRAEITKLINRISILEGKIERRRKRM